MPEKDKKVQGKGAKKPSLNKKLLFVSVMLATVIILGAVLWRFFLQPSEGEVKFSLKAVIIDQLSEDFSNQTFVDGLTKILKRHKFDVEYYNHTKTRVEFFKGLAAGNYGIIILRTHAALRKDGSTVDFFTSEPYDASKYTELQDRGLLVKGELNISQTTVKRFFAFTSKFVKELKGVFPKSIIIAMGCQTLNQTAGIPMAEAFLEKGATVYIGWSGWVSAPHSDLETIKLMQRLLDGDETIEQAVGKASPDQLFLYSRLKFYPETHFVKNLRISDLIREAQASSQTTELAFSEDYYVTEAASDKRFNSLATTVYSWFRRFSPDKFVAFNFLISSANAASSKTSFIHFSKSPR